MKRPWMIVFGCILGLSVSLSGVFYATLPVFEKSIAASTGWSRTQVIFGLSICTLSGMVSSPLIGRQIDRLGPRRVIVLAALPFGLSLMAMKLIGASYIGYLALAMLIGLFGNCANTFVYLSFLPKWFDRRLGLSLSISATGIGIGQTLGPVVAFALLRHVGWQNGFVVIGVLVIVVTMFSALSLLRDKPTYVAASKAGDVFSVLGVTHTDALRSKVFWRLAASIFLITLAVAGSVISLVPLLTDRGVPAPTAVSMAAVTGFSVLLGRLAGGFLLDHIAAAKVARVIFVAPAFGIALLLLGLSPENYFYTVPPLIGIALGAEGDIMAYVVRRSFGPRACGEIYSYLWSVFMGGLLVGPVLMSVSHGFWNSYNPALVLLCSCAIFSALIFPDKNTTAFAPLQKSQSKGTGAQKGLSASVPLRLAEAEAEAAQRQGISETSI